MILLLLLLHRRRAVAWMLHAAASDQTHELENQLLPFGCRSLLTAPPNSATNSRRPMPDMGGSLPPSGIAAGSACHRGGRQVHGADLNCSEGYGPRWHGLRQEFCSHARACTAASRWPLVNAW